MTRLGTILVALLALLACAAPAMAQTPRAEVMGQKAQFDGGAENNELSVAFSDANDPVKQYTFTETATGGPNIIPGPGCVSPSGVPSKTVVCNVPSGTGTTVNLGDGNNNVVYIGAWPQSGQTNSATGGAGQDTFTGNDAPATFTGGANSDTFFGGNANETFIGGAGADDFAGNGGRDLVDYNGNSTAVKAAIDNSANSGAGCLTVISCEGDTIRSTVEDIRGGSGGDTLIGSTADNTLTGQGGADTLIALAGEDTLNGDAGNDTLDGGVGKDTLAGGADNDTVTYADRVTPVTVNLAVTTATQGADAEQDTITAVENAIGGAGADTLSGQGDTTVNVLTGNGGADKINGLGGADTLNGDAGDDEINGGDAADTVNGGADNDTITGGAAADTLKGDAGNDAISGDAADDAIDGGAGDDTLKGNAGADDLTGGEGTDTVDYSASTLRTDVTLNDQADDGEIIPDDIFGDASEGDNVHLDVENMKGGTGPDAFTATTAKNVFEGGDGSDTMRYSTHTTPVTVDLVAATGGSTGEGDVLNSVENAAGGTGNDTLYGTPGPNSLAGNGGDDVLDGGLGADVINGGEGSDTADYLLGNRTEAIEVQLIGGTANDGSGEDGPAGARDTLLVDNVIGTAFNDVITGSSTDNRLEGRAGDDVINGGVGADDLRGGVGSDDLFGSAGADTLDPGSLNGGADGADLVDGGQEADTATYVGRTAGVTVTLDDATDVDGKGNDGTGAEGDDVRSNVENVVGGSGADTLTASAAGAAPNTFDGGAGDDTITTYAGNDTVNGGAGQDTVDTGEGDDTINVDEGEVDTVKCGTTPLPTPVPDPAPVENDTVNADKVDVVDADCETVNRSNLGSATPTPTTTPTVTPSPSPDGTTTPTPGTNQAPKANFTASPNPGVAGQPVTFNASSSSDPDGTIARYEWDLDNNGTFETDGKTSPTIQRTFQSAATYRIVLRVTDDKGATNSVAANFVVTGAASGCSAVTARQKVTSVSLSVTPRRDRTAPFKFRASGKVAIPSCVTAGDGCQGRVKLRVRRGKTTILNKTVSLSSTCTYKASLVFKNRAKLKNAKTIDFRASFAGNEFLLPRSSKTIKRSVR
jgi:Ca2+-binding RTX toxin-like protein